MSRVTYILGAGASYGERKFNDSGTIKSFTRGLPIVSELERAIQLLQRGEGNGVFFVTEEARRQNVSPEQYQYVAHCLSLLEQACASFPTIDTLAKQLYVTGNKFFTATGNEIDYARLKHYLTTTLLMLQEEKKRDLRYDGFIASLINSSRKFPAMTILSWNYDVQFEMAYSGYYTSDRYIPSLWKELNVFNKMYPTEFDHDSPFAMIKLNGTALFTDSDLDKIDINGEKANRITDCFYGGPIETPYQYGYKYLNNCNYNNLLSYAWEDDNMAMLQKIIEFRTYDTEELIVIGYSFPYVNNEVDSFILQNMHNLKKVVIQDSNFTDIKERVEGILEPVKRNPIIVSKKNLQQFYIPNRFV